VTLSSRYDSNVSGGIQAEAFQKFEHTSWRRAVEPYHDNWGRLTEQTIDPLLEALDVQQNTSIVDVATGPGYVAAAASARGVNAIGVDFSREMVKKARTIHPQVLFLEGDALNLPFKEGAFDAACMNFGIMHLANPEDGLRELFRVVRPGGRVAFTAWAPPEEAEGFRIILSALDGYDTPSDLPIGPDFFRFGRSRECIAACVRAGIRSPRVHLVSPMYWRMPTAAGFFRRSYTAWFELVGCFVARAHRHRMRSRIELQLRSKPFESMEVSTGFRCRRY
jgi:ubiquinone/menaquinone biosynthesis C-methylase UbiE